MVVEVTMKRKSCEEHPLMAGHFPGFLSPLKYVLSVHSSNIVLTATRGSNGPKSF